MRRVGSGLAMILAPMLWFASSALGPGHEASRHLADMLSQIAANPNRFLASVLSGLLSLILFVPAVLGVESLVRRRRPLLALTGAALVVIGILSLAVVQGVQLVQHQMISAPADRGQMVALLERLEGGIGLKVIFVGTFALFVGWVLMSAALLATRVVPRLIPLSILVSLVLNLVGFERFSRVFFLVGLGWLGLLVVAEAGCRFGISRKRRRAID